MLRGWADDLARDLSALGVRVFPTETYFFPADFAPHDAGDVASQLAARKIMVRPLGDDRLGGGYMRITTSTPQDNARFVAELRNIL